MPFLIEIEVSRRSVTLRKRPQLKAFKRETLHRDTSTPLREIEVSRYVWTALVRALALPPATTTLALEGQRIAAFTARSAAGEARTGAMVTYRKHSKPMGDCLDDMGPRA